MCRAPVIVIGTYSTYFSFFFFRRISTRKSNRTTDLNSSLIECLTHNHIGNVQVSGLSQLSKHFHHVGKLNKCNLVGRRVDAMATRIGRNVVAAWSYG